MQAYFVRMQNDRQVVGIFTANSIESLQDLVDECTDPADCEYLVMGEGGLFQPSRVKGQFPPRNSGEPFYEPDPDDEQALVGARYCEWWDERLDSNRPWKPLVKGAALKARPANDAGRAKRR